MRENTYNRSKPMAWVMLALVGMFSFAGLGFAEEAASTGDDNKTKAAAWIEGKALAEKHTSGDANE